MKKVQNISKKTFPIIGMHCASCAKLIEKKLLKTEGIKSAYVNYGSETATVETDPRKINDNDIAKIVEKMGYKAFISDKLQVTSNKSSEEIKEEEKKKQLADLKLKVIISSILSVIIFIGSFPDWFPFFPSFPATIYLLLATVVQFWAGREIYLSFWSALRNKSVNMDTLIVMGTSSAFLFSALSVLVPGLLNKLNIPLSMYFDTSSVIITLILLGRYLESNAKSHTSDAIRKLIGLRPKTARVLWNAYGLQTTAYRFKDNKNYQEIDVPLEQVVVGNFIRVRPGEKISVDGVIVDGFSEIDESMITGESMPVFKKKEDFVIGGTINKSGTFIFRAQKVGSETMLSHIVDTVSEAQGSRAPIQNIADTVSSYFVPVVIVLAFITFIIWMIFGNFGIAFSNMIAVLVIACPCALGLATPTAIMVVVGRGAEEGILIKDAESLEITEKVGIVVFDKTGTLTEGKPSVTDVMLVQNSKFKSEEEILALAASLEKGSEHSIGEAVINKARQKGIELIKLTEFNAILGKGVEGVIDDNRYYFGNRSLIKEKKVIFQDKVEEQIKRFEDEGKTCMLLADNHQLLGLIAVADTLKSTARRTIEKLNSSGVETWMITGDNERTAKAIAKQVRIENVIANVLPDEKADKIEDLRSKSRDSRIVFIGDGINDAPALASSDVGIAMGTGTDIAVESAGITLLGKDLGNVVKAIELSRKTMITIKQNLIWAFGYNAILIPVAMGILYPFIGKLLSPELAAFTMAASSISVVSNSLRLKRI